MRKTQLENVNSFQGSASIPFKEVMRAVESLTKSDKVNVFQEFIKSGPGVTCIDLIPKSSLHYTTTRFSLFPNFKVSTKLFSNSFFPYTANERNNLDNIIKLSESYLTFRKWLLNLIRPKCNETSGIHHPTGLKLLTSLRLGLSHLNDHRFNHNFWDRIKQLSSCRLIVENSVHFFLPCHYSSLQRQTLMNSLRYYGTFNFWKTQNSFQSY